MTVKEVVAKVFTCDTCGRGLPDRTLPLQHILESVPYRRISVDWQAGEDCCLTCQKKAVAQAARELGIRKPRGRAAHKDTPGPGASAAAETPPATFAAAPPPHVDEPAEAPLPTPDDIRGIMPNITGGKPSERYVKDRWRGKTEGQPPAEAPSVGVTPESIAPPARRHSRGKRRKDYQAAGTFLTPTPPFQPGDIVMPDSEGMAPGPYRVEDVGEDMAGRPYVTALLPDGTREQFFTNLLRSATAKEKP